MRKKLQHIGFITSIDITIIIVITINQIFQITSFCHCPRRLLCTPYLYELLWKFPQIPICIQQLTAFSLMKWKYLQGSQLSPVWHPEDNNLHNSMWYLFMEECRNCCKLLPNLLLQIYFYSSEMLQHLLSTWLLLISVLRACSNRAFNSS